MATHYCLLFRAIQLLLLFPVFSVRLRAMFFTRYGVIFSQDIICAYRICVIGSVSICVQPSLSVWTALHIFLPLLPVTADCTGWYNFLPSNETHAAIIQNQNITCKSYKSPHIQYQPAHRKRTLSLRVLPDLVPSKNLSFSKKVYNTI